MANPVMELAVARDTTLNPVRALFSQVKSAIVFLIASIGFCSCKMRPTTPCTGDAIEAITNDVYNVLHPVSVIFTLTLGIEVHPAF